MAKKGFKSAIDSKTKLGEKAGISGVFSSTSEKKVTPVTQVIQEDENEPQNIRQTFVILDTTMETLKDYVYMQKKNIDPLYTQKEALQEALDLLFSKYDEIPERPLAVKKKEASKKKK